MKKLLLTLPCYNEELLLENNLGKILNYAENNLSDHDFKILIIDNASSDKTYAIAQRLSSQNDRILADRCELKGRGVALRTMWQKHTGYDTYSYMDIDLATDLKDFRALLGNIDSGSSISVGSRYVTGADIKRLPTREFLSRIYNLLLKIFFNVKFKDAQCGFKAFEGVSLQKLLPKTKDDGWFWDTEIMILTEKSGLKNSEVPVTWVEIRDEIRKSKVSPFIEVARQLKNIVRLRISLWRNR